MQTLQEFIDAVTWVSQLSISVHDLSGFTESSMLHLCRNNLIHASPFCRCAQSNTAGMERCIRCKNICNKAAARGRGFSGYCPNGLTEIVQPIMAGEKTIGIIYVGNLVRHDEEFEKRLRECCNITGLDAQHLRTLSSACREYDDLAVFESFADSVCNYINLLYKQNEICNAGNTHWAVNSLKNDADTFFFNDISISMLAKLYHLNAKYAGRIFKKYTGLSFSDYVNRVRIKRAKELLLQPKTVLDISMECGFNNIGYFNRTFKKIVGCTPSKYRHDGKNTN